MPAHHQSDHNHLRRIHPRQLYTHPIVSSRRNSDHSELSRLGRLRATTMTAFRHTTSDGWVLMIRLLRVLINGRIVCCGTAHCLRLWSRTLYCSDLGIDTGVGVLYPRRKRRGGEGYISGIHLLISCSIHLIHCETPGDLSGRRRSHRIRHRERDRLEARECRRGFRVRHHEYSRRRVHQHRHSYMLKPSRNPYGLHRTAHQYRSAGG